MDKIIIEGGSKLKGEVKVSGSKNAALPILMASLLVDGVSTFTNVPELQDIETTKLLLNSFGAKTETDKKTVQIDASKLSNFEANYDLVRKMRASILALGPLVARFKKAKISLPGGCAIGARPVNLHIKALELLGAKIELKYGYIEAYAKDLKGAEIYFDTQSVTGTENTVMAAVFAKGTTVIQNAAREPEVVALCDVLNLMGAKIKGAGTGIIEITGVSGLKEISAEIIPDRIEAGTLLVAGALNESEVKVSNCNPSDMVAIIDKLRLTGAEVKVAKKSITVKGVKEICSIDITTLPFPGFPTDMQAQFMVLMTIANGQSFFSETIFEKRFMHVSELQRMGANISILGSNAAVVKGVKNHLFGAPVMASDLRASASLILAGLIAKGKTEVSRIYHLDRGYERLEKKLESLGAKIKRLS